jgi:hypothetical protein
MNLGTSPSSSINQAVRTFNRLPSGAVKGPSMTYRVPKMVLSSIVMSLSFACCFRAPASSSQRDESNPNCMKKEALLLPARWVVERRYLTILASLISALSASGSLILNLASRQTHLALPYISFWLLAEPFLAYQFIDLSAASTSFEVRPKEFID